MNGLSGFALAGYLNDLERKKKKAYGAVDTLNKEMGASDQYQGARNRTNDWLASLSPEELARVSPESRNLSSNFEGVGDVYNFDTTKRANELGLTSQYKGVEGIDDYLKGLDEIKKNKKQKEVSTALENATSGMQRNKQFEDLNALEELAGMKKGDYNLKSNRDIAVGAGLPKYAGNENVDKFMSAFVEKPEEQQLDKEKNAKGGRAYSSNLLNMATEEDRKRALEIIDAIEQAGGYMDTPEQLQLDRGFAQTNPLLFMQKFSEKMRGTSEGLRGKKEAIPINAENTAATTSAGEKTKREIQADNPILNENQGGALSDAYNAVNYLNKLKSELQKGNVGYFDIDRKTGQFVNPDVADAYLQLVEIVGRKRSGAAISESEWKNFGKQILNKNNLLTDAGKKTAIESINRYLDKFYGSGVTTTGNEDWYNNYKSKSSSARQKAEGTTDSTNSTFDDLWSKYGGK